MAFRRGQWVTTTRPLLIDLVPVAGQALQVTVPAGAVGIHHPLDVVKRDAAGTVVAPGRVYHREGAQPTAVEAADPAGLVGLHLVDEATGFITILEAAVPPDALTAVTAREQVPAPRLATYDPAWQPRA